MHAHISVFFDKEHPAHKKFLDALLPFQMLEFGNEDPAFNDVGLVEILPHDEDDRINYAASLATLEILRNEGIEYFAINGHMTEDDDLVGPSTFDIFFNGEHIVIPNEAPFPDFTAEQLIAAGMDSEVAESICRFFIRESNVNCVIQA